LRMAGTNIDERALKVLAHTTPCPTLTALDLGGTWLGDEGMAWLARTSWPEHLQELGLYGVRLSHNGVQALSAAFGQGSWPLQTLDLSFNSRLGDQGLRELALCTGLETLKTLRLRRCDISSDGIASLVNCCPTWLHNLHHLDLSDNHIGDRGADLMASLETLPTGACIDLSSNRLTRAASRAVARTPLAERVRFITEPSSVMGSLLD
ncbi:MAG: hypothetical protein AAFS10_28210, partial [Myxococcota bacterium]